MKIYRRLDEAGKSNKKSFKNLRYGSQKTVSKYLKFNWNFSRIRLLCALCYVHFFCAPNENPVISLSNCTTFSWLSDGLFNGVPQWLPYTVKGACCRIDAEHKCLAPLSQRRKAFMLKNKGTHEHCLEKLAPQSVYFLLLSYCIMPALKEIYELLSSLYFILLLLKHIQLNRRTLR